MGEKIKLFWQKALYPYTYIIAFISFKSAQYLPAFSFLYALLFFITASFCCYIINLILPSFSTNRYTTVITLLVAVSVLHVAGVAHLVGYSYTDIPLYFYICFYAGIVLIVIPWLYMSMNKIGLFAPIINRLLNTFFIICAFVFVMVGYYRQHKEVSRFMPISIMKKPGQVKPDIVWILLDEYGSSAVLHTSFSFVNPLDSALSQEGFYIMNRMKSRFDNTLFSVNAIFTNDDSVRPASFYAGVRSLQQSEWVPVMDTFGYQFVNLGLFDIGGHSKFSNRSGYPQIYTDQLLSGTLIDMVIQNVKYTIGKCDAFNQHLLNKLKDTLAYQSSRPRFIWAHLSIPHEPFCRDRAGHMLHDKAHNGYDSVFIKRRYIDYLEYGNNIIRDLIRSSPGLGKKIIIITGDHGPRYAFLKDSSCRNWPFAAIRVPGNFDTNRLNNLQYISQLPAFIMKYLNAGM